MGAIFEEVGVASSVLFLWKTATIILMAVEVVKAIGLVMLMIWHFFIWHLGISTYQFLVEKEKLDEMKDKLKKGDITQS